MTHKTDGAGTTRFVVNRSKWRCGAQSVSGDCRPENTHGEGTTELLNYEGYMCCLGFVCEQSGVISEDLLSKGEPGELKRLIPFLTVDHSEPDYPYYPNTVLAEAAIAVNDDEDYTMEAREETLKKLFGDQGIELIFEGEYEDRT